MVGKIKAMAAGCAYAVVCTSFFMAARTTRVPPCLRKTLNAHALSAASWNRSVVGISWSAAIFASVS